MSLGISSWFLCFLQPVSDGGGQTALQQQDKAVPAQSTAFQQAASQRGPHRPELLFPVGLERAESTFAAMWKTRQN